jgi:anhydro-N-acetylmuramic acid kinase
MSQDWVTAIGMMSGTSMDGVDAALLKSDGQRIERLGEPVSLPYGVAERNLIRAALGGGGDVPAAERAVTFRHVECIDVLLKKNSLTSGNIDVIGFHGQTIVHRPDEGLTWQIGDAALLAARTGIDVVADFRRHDMAMGGEGAPFAPLYHGALVEGLDRPGPVCVLNLGGVANVTWIGRGTIIAFDTGPGGALLDDWISRHSDESFDRDGALAASGRCHDDRVAAVLTHPYFDRAAPKSLDRNAFAIDLAGLSPADGAATLVALTARTVARAVDHVPAPPGCWIVCGGNRLNPTLLRAIAGQVSGDVMTAEDVGWNGDAIEAEAFAYLAVRSLKALPLSLPTTTGVAAPTTGGALHRARTRN